MSKYQTQIITRADQIPTGYVPPSHLRGVSPAKWVTVAKGLSEAHAAGMIRAVKLVRCLGDLKTGRVFLHEQDAREYVEGRYGSVTAPQPEADEPPVVEVNVPAALPAADVAELLETMQRLTAAVVDLTAAVRLRSEAEFQTAGGGGDVIDLTELAGAGCPGR